MEKIQWNRTDLIDEAEEVVLHRTPDQKEKLKESSGIHIEEWNEARVKMTKVTVDEKGEAQIGKKQGVYLTLSVPTMTSSDKIAFEQLEKSFSHHLKELHKDLNITKEQPILVIGLGNKTITPDAIGPFAIDSMHKVQGEFETPPFILYAPGVTGQTGFETSEFIAALTDKIKPALVIVIDALATSGSSRLCRTIQITNTGIHPGSGVGNQRAEISKEALGVPVTAIGIPTVVEAPILISDAIDAVFRSIAAKIEERGKPSHKLSVTPWQPQEGEVNLELIRPIFGEWTTWTTEDRRQLFEEVFSSHPERLMVTPKEVDIWLIQYAVLLSTCLFNWRKTEHGSF